MPWIPTNQWYAIYGFSGGAAARMRGVDADGSAPLCATVDRARNDYLRDMYDEKRRLVIDDIAELPRQLPKIHSEATRGG